MSPEYNQERVPLSEWRAEKASREREWQQQVRKVKKRIATLTEKHDDPKIEEGISNGMHQLIHDAFTYTSPFTPKAKLAENLPIEELKNSLTEILLQALPEEPPKKVTLMQGEPSGLLVGRPKKYDFTGPVNIALLLDRYGLVNGEGKTLEELAETYRLPEWRLPTVLVQTLSLIHRNSTIQELVLQPKTNL